MENKDQSAARPVVAIINTSEETAELLSDLLEEENFTPAIGYVVDFKRGRTDLEVFFATHQPQAVLWDIALPYVENWNFFRERVLSANFVPPERFVVTTANKTILDILVGPTATIELIGRPFDLETILEAVRRCAKQ